MSEQTAAIDAPVRYGILDGDGYWMGGEDGPVTYDNLLLARCAATVLWHQFEQTREFRVEPFTSASKIRDSIDASMTTLDALKIAEGESPTPHQDTP